MRRVLVEQLTRGGEYRWFTWRCDGFSVGPGRALHLVGVFDADPRDWVLPAELWRAARYIDANAKSLLEPVMTAEEAVSTAGRLGSGDEARWKRTAETTSTGGER